MCALLCFIALDYQAHTLNQHPPLQKNTTKTNSKTKNSYGVDVDPKLVQLLGFRPRTPWRKFVNDDNRHLVNADALSLLDALLRYDHAARPTAAEAMAHPYFAPVRAELEREEEEAEEAAAAGR